MTRRAPINVPYLVDNPWEWRRPLGFACRRHAVYALPSLSLANKFNPTDGRVYRVVINGDFTMNQLIGWKDSKEHPEYKSLPKLLLKCLGQAWIDSSLSEKQDAGRLWIPCLAAVEVEHLFESVPILKGIKNQAWKAIEYWDKVIKVESTEKIPDVSGELFFEAPMDYALELVDGV